jgi:hypothetical protein
MTQKDSAEKAVRGPSPVGYSGGICCDRTMQAYFSVFLSE